MPYKSAAQRAYFHANRRKLAAQGVDVAEWDRKSKDKKLDRLVRLVEFMRGDYAIAHAARKGWLDQSGIFPRGGKSPVTAWGVEKRLAGIQDLIKTARSKVKGPMAAPGGTYSRYMLADWIRNSRRVIR